MIEGKLFEKQFVHLNGNGNLATPITFGDYRNPASQFFLSFIPIDVGETMVLCRSDVYYRAKEQEFPKALVWVSKEELSTSSLYFSTLEHAEQKRLFQTIGFTNQSLNQFLISGSGLEFSMHCNQPMRVGSTIQGQLINPIQIRSIKNGQPDKLLCWYRESTYCEFLPYSEAKDYSIAHIEQLVL